MPYNQKIPIPTWPYVYGGPSGTGKIRVIPEDFLVFENLSFQPSGSGEHVFLLIRKKGENTDYVARQLARFANVRQRDIGYAGMKDRHAITTQWFSVWLPGKAEPDWQFLNSETMNVFQVIRHDRKLKRGALNGNSFNITVLDWQGNQEKCISQLEQIRINGIANYYGEQRFGHHGRNVAKALDMFRGMKVNREQRSLYLSAARSFIFNQILSARVKQQNWNKAVMGDCFMFDRSNSFFQTEFPDADLVRRMEEKIVHPGGTLWGKGRECVSGVAQAIEQTVMTSFSELAQGLIAADVELSLRPLRVMVTDMEWQIKDITTLQLSFSLPAGSYATSVLREIIDYGIV